MRVAIDDEEHDADQDDEGDQVAHQTGSSASAGTIASDPKQRAW